MKKVVAGFLLSFCCALAYAQDTIKVQTFTFDKADRSGVFLFPNDPSQKYEKVIMQYSLRCKGGLISTSADRNKGCGEWDYNCYTYLVDTARVDSFKTTRSSHDISGFSGTSFPFTTMQYNNYVRYTQKNSTVTSISAPDSAKVGVKTSNFNMFGGTDKAAKIQILWTAAELVAAGLKAGSISSLWFDAASLGGNINALRMKIASSALTQLSASAPLQAGLTEVYFQDTKLTINGINKLIFHTPFTWNGTSNILVELTYTNKKSDPAYSILGDNNTTAKVITSVDNDAYLNFTTGGQLVDLGKAPGIKGRNVRTIEGWALARSFNDGGIWDAGGKNAIGGDFSFRTSTVVDQWRVQTWGAPDFDVTLPGSLGSWHHFAMQYDGTTIKLYYDGELKGSKAYVLNTLEDNFRLGTWYGTTFNGYIDDIRVWDTVIPPAVIKDWMTRKLDSSHPYYSHLKANYTMDEGAGKAIVDKTNQQPDGAIQGDPLWFFHKGNEKFKNFSNSTQRPFVTFGQGAYNTVVTNVYSYDTIPVTPRTVIAYKTKGNDIEVIDTTYKTHASGFAYTYNADGTKLDSTAITPTGTIAITQLNYFKKAFSKIELINFITPYGIDLDLNGLKGKTWHFDVTDYMPVLKGARYLSIEDGRYQEEMDIRFLFIKGTPVRDVKDIRQIWPSGSTVSTNYAQAASEAMFEPRTYKLDASAAGFKIRSSISGHGQEGEFTSKQHYIGIQPAGIMEKWNVWKACGANPVYPQGGTWIYDRAGWCPGSAVDIKEIDLTGKVTPGQDVTLDYGMTTFIPGAGAWNYRVNNQLVTYGALNFNRDAGIEYIQNPSTRVEFQRENPMCNNPQVLIKNTGKDPITNLEIQYGLQSGPMSTYTWTGTIASLATQMVSLPYLDWVAAPQTDIFTAQIMKVNGSADDYANNNKFASNFVKPVVYPADLIVSLRANARPRENMLTIQDAAGNIVYQTPDLIANKTNADTLQLPKGCYYLKITDGGKDGLSFWNNTAQGVGSLQLKNANDGKALYTFNPDFGSWASQQFFVTENKYFLGIKGAPQAADISLTVFPSPASQDVVWVRATLPAYTDATLYVTNVLGQVVSSQELHLVDPSNPVPVDISNFKNGIYQAVLKVGNTKVTEKFSVIR